MFYNNIYFIIGMLRELLNFKLFDISYNNFEIVNGLDCFIGFIELNLSYN